MSPEESETLISKKAHDGRPNIKVLLMGFLQVFIVILYPSNRIATVANKNIAIYVL